MKDTRQANVHNLPYVEQLYSAFQRKAEGVGLPWQEYFSGAERSAEDEEASPLIQTGSKSGGTSTLHERLQELIRNYRVRGHIIAQTDPLGSTPASPRELNPDFYAFTETELDLVTNCASLPYDQPLSVREIFQRLRDTYCRSIGAQFMHIDAPEKREWLQRRMEVSQNRLRLPREDQRRILTRLNDAILFEEFLRKRFVGAKTFSLEGCETLLPLLDLTIERAGEQGVDEVVMGMAHRGRLNVLANIVGKNPHAIFREFVDPAPDEWRGRGDVRYHLGHAGEWTTAAGRKMQIVLCPNPSHLEFVNPIVLGRVRARQDRIGDEDRRRVLGILIHGDAAFAGQGIVQETLNFSRLAGYRVGGVLHVIINNQIGFTTTPPEGRSTPYATDVARLLQIPILHVNGEDPEAVAQVVRLAMDFRKEFQEDVVIDMYGYRRWGHNETDEPSFTQPLLYQAIKKRPNVRAAYLDHLIQLKGVTSEEAKNLAAACTQRLEEQLAAAREAGPTASEVSIGPRDSIGGPEPTDEPDTGVEATRLSKLLRKLATVPADFALHPKLERELKARREMADGLRPLDWSAAEALALATLAVERVRIRLAGQDSIRGTFSQRHAGLYDQRDGSPYIPLQHLTEDQAFVEVINSPLNEAGALGFEYGYSLDWPDGLVIWEAQFGDFANAGQVIIDQFLASAEDKWEQLSNLVLLLPHGFEGMGAEHSSARIERFLGLAAEDNLQVVQPTTPAQYFHCLRRQALRRWRKPLVVFTPKSLLRHPKVVSPLSDCAHGRFQRVLEDNRNGEATEQILFCTGKVFYELAARREEQHREDVTLVRLEQLYPLRDVAALVPALASRPKGAPVIWVQEEPENMGAWPYLRRRFGDSLLGRWPLQLVSRPESASPATGSSNAHKQEQADLIHRALEPTAAGRNPAARNHHPQHTPNHAH